MLHSIPKLDTRFKKLHHKKIEIKVSDLEFIDINTLDFYDLEHTIKSNITNLKYECEIIYKKFDKKFNEINWPKFHLQTYE